MKPNKQLWLKLNKKQKESWKRIYKEVLQQLKQGYSHQVIAHNIALLGAWDSDAERKHGFLTFETQAELNDCTGQIKDKLYENQRRKQAG